MKTETKKTSLIWRFIEYFLYVYIVAFPFVSIKIFLYSGSSTRAMTLILFSIISGLVALIWYAHKENSLHIPKSPILAAAGLYLVVVIISAIFGEDFSTSFWSVITRLTGIWYFLHLGVVVFMIYSLIQHSEKAKDKIILVTILSTALFSLISLLGPEGWNAIFSSYKNDALTFGNSSFAGMYIFGAFLLSLYYVYSAPIRKWWMYILPVILVINPYVLNARIWSGVFSSGLVGEARASAYVIIASIVILFVVWMLSKLKDVRIKKITAYSLLGLYAVGILIGSVSLLSSDGYLKRVYLSQATETRPLVWEMSQKAIASKPVLGYGIDNFARAFERNYDNRLLENKYGGEAWLDRAHNVLIDQMVESGILGLIAYILVYVVISLCMIYSLFNANNRKDAALAFIILVYFALHFLELQTAFDTTISYFMVALMLALSIWVFTKVQNDKKGNAGWNIVGVGKYSIVGVLFIFFVWSLIWGFIPYVRAQLANGYVRTIGSAEKRLEAYPALFGSPVDKHSVIWRTFLDFERAIGSSPSILSNRTEAALLKKEVLVFEQEYRDYIASRPNHFRAKLNLADVLMYENLFGENKLEEAGRILDEAITMVPDAPQPYWMKAVASLYMKKFPEARSFAKKALELNPDIEESQKLSAYIERSIKEFPVVDLYFFKHI